jgi:hypothetical protein
VEDQPLLQVYTPGSDLAAGFNQNQLIWGRAGNDALLGFQPVEETPTQPQIDILVADVALDDPAAREWSDIFVLGDWTQPYYANGNSSTFGLNDFALVLDFDQSQDFAQLYGTSSNYQLLDVGIGSAVLLENETGFDTVSFLLGSSNLSLEESYFDFQGFTPPQTELPQAQQQGTEGFDISATTATDAFGNVYVAGGTTGSLGADNVGESRDAFVSKYDSQGNLLFTQQFGTSSFETISGIATDPEGNFYVAGITAGDLAGPKQATDSDAFVAKFDSEGNQQWIQQFGQNSIFQSYSIDVDAAGNAYLTGIDVKPSETEIATDDFWAAKFDTNGNQEWFTEVGSSDDAFDESYDVTVSNDGSVYTTGWTLGDLGAPNAGVYDAHITKFDNDGEVEWIQQLGTSDYEWGWGVDTDSQGNVYAAGWTLGDLGGENAGSYDIWLTKYDSQGNQQWLQQFGSAEDDQGFDLFIDSNDNIFLTGYTKSDLAGNNAGSFDAWAARYDTDGNQIWLEQFGTPDFDQAYAITSDAAGNLFVTGVTQGSLGDSNSGSFDTWTAKLDIGSGGLLDFSGISPADSVSTVSFASSIDNSPQLTDEDANYIGGFFKDFLASLGIGSDGSGIETLLSNPYGEPTPPPVSVPEPSFGAGLLVVATLSWASAKLRSHFKSTSKS